MIVMVFFIHDKKTLTVEPYLQVRLSLLMSTIDSTLFCLSVLVQVQNNPSSENETSTLKLKMIYLFFVSRCGSITSTMMCITNW